MPRARAVVIELTAAERRILKQRDRGGKTPWQDRVRAQIVRRAARGHPNERIARELAITIDTVRMWRGRFAAEGLDGLADRPRSGRPTRRACADDRRRPSTALRVFVPNVRQRPNHL